MRCRCIQETANGGGGGGGGAAAAATTCIIDWGGLERKCFEVEELRQEPL